MLRLHPLSKAIKYLPLALSVGSGAALAELKLLDDSALKSVRGQAGLTIDIETKHTIGEFEYVDAGSLFIRDIRFQGIGGGYVDNIRARVDITDGSEYLVAGFADMAVLEAMGKLDANEADVAWAMSEYVSGTGEIGKQFGDGDLLIHVTSQDFGMDLLAPSGPADFAANLDATKNAVDLHIFQGELGLRSSDGSMETVLTRNFSVEAYLGYVDILITNNGNGFHEGETVSGGEPGGDVRLGDSYISIDAKFRVEDLDVDSTNNATNTYVSRNVTNPYLTLRDMRIHNERGADTLGYFGYASVEQKIGAATDIIPSMDVLAGHARHGTLTSTNNYRVDGIAFYDINVRWDWDLPHIQFGNHDKSIGEVYFTDFVIADTSLVISAH